MQLTVSQFHCYAEQIASIRKAEATMALAIATNPHLEAKHQRRLWTQLKDFHTLPPIRHATGERKQYGEQLQKLIDEGKR